MNLGNHIILDLFDVDKSIFENKLSIISYSLFDEYIKKSLINNKMNLLNSNIHFFNNINGALTALYLLSESHLSIHTWPEKNYIAIDVFTCGDCDTNLICNDLIRYLEPKNIMKKNIKRGELKDKLEVELKPKAKNIFNYLFHY